MATPLTDLLSSQRILAKHKKQMRQLEDAHANQLRQSELAAQRDRDEALRRLRERLDAEREEAVAAAAKQQEVGSIIAAKS